MASQVEQNFKAFQELLPDIIKQYAGKTALMVDGEIVDYFDSFADAIRFGNLKYGESKFSVQEVTTEGVDLGELTNADLFVSD